MLLLLFRYIADTPPMKKPKVDPATPATPKIESQQQHAGSQPSCLATNHASTAASTALAASTSSEPGANQMPATRSNGVSTSRGGGGGNPSSKVSATTGQQILPGAQQPGSRQPSLASQLRANSSTHPHSAAGSGHQHQQQQPVAQQIDDSLDVSADILCDVCVFCA